MSSRIISFRPAAQPWRLPLQCQRHSSSGCLLSRLQSSLDPQQLMRIYWQELQQLLGVGGLDWQLAGLSQQVQLGSAPGGWRRAYQLWLGSENLGELRISRGTPLRAQEERLLEQTLDLLLRPLYNAVLYQQALAAARQDRLTGLGNRAAFEEALAQEVELAHRHDMPLSLLLIDIDRFKHINDSLGHLAGDAVLRGVAAALQDLARQSDLLFRYAGDEFVVLMRQTERAGAYAVAERIRSVVERQVIQYGEHGLTVQLSIGFAAVAAGEEGRALFERADQALLAAKRSGRNQTSWAAAPAGEQRALSHMPM